MKKKLVLIVLLYLANSFTLLAQNNKTDSAALAKSKIIKEQNDKKAANKALKAAAEKNKKDSIANVKALKNAAEKSRKAGLVIEKSNKNNVEKLRKDSINSSAKNLKYEKKTNADTSILGKSAKITSAKTDTPLTGKRKGQQKKEKKEKTKSARALKREQFKNDPVNFSEKQIAAIGFKNVKIDPSEAPPRPDIAFINARPYTLNEPDPNNIKFFHRYWRDIDVTDPQNKKINDYHAVLISSLLSAIKKKEIRAYSPAAGTPQNPSGDAFTIPIGYDELMSGLSDTAVVNILDKDGNITGTKTVPNPFSPDKISGYRIKEDVFYDKIRGRMFTRIIGVAPLVKLTLSSGEVISVQPLCWLKYKDCRKIFVTIDIDPTKKVGESMDDIFLQRRFYSRIVEESNPEGLRIKDYKAEIAAQQAESDRIEKKIAQYKKGSWSYIMSNDALETETYTKTAVKTKKVKVKTAAQQKP